MLHLIALRDTDLSLCPRKRAYPLAYCPPGTRAHKVHPLYVRYRLHIAGMLPLLTTGIYLCSSQGKLSMLQLLLQEVKHINRTLEIQSGSWVLQFHIRFRIVYQIQRFGKRNVVFFNDHHRDVTHHTFVHILYVRHRHFSRLMAFCVPK